MVLQDGVVAGGRWLHVHPLGVFAVVIVGMAGVHSLSLGTDQAALPAQVLGGRRILASHDGVSLHGHRCARRRERSGVWLGTALAVGAIVGARVLEVRGASAARGRLAEDMAVVSAASRGVVGSPWQRHYCGARNAECRGRGWYRGRGGSLGPKE